MTANSLCRKTIRAAFAYQAARLARIVTAQSLELTLEGSPVERIQHHPDCRQIKAPLGNNQIVAFAGQGEKIESENALSCSGCDAAVGLSAVNMPGLFAYSWGGGRLLSSDGIEGCESIAVLSSKDIILFKQHPEAISARNLLESVVRSLFQSGGKVGVELDCGGETLIAEIVPDAARELGVTVGITVYAGVKATTFRLLPAGPERTVKP